VPKPSLYLLTATLFAISASVSAQSEHMAQAKHDMQERLKAADTNGDGFIDRQEADAKLPRVAKNFDKLDADQDGKLSPSELKQAAELARQRLGR
jgi:Ca2+-binding EF-hand superfamily protein